MEKILVTGGSGFIGTHLINFLAERNYEILNLDTATPRLKEHLPYWKKADLRHAEQLAVIKAFAPEIVIHLAARTDLRGKTMDDYTANTDGVTNLLAVLDEVPSLKKAIFTSSMYVCRPGYKPKDFDDYNPHTVYGESKVRTEQIIKNRNPSYSWSIIRPTSIWGPYFGEPYNLFFNIVLSGKYFHLGKKACKKTYGYIGNVIYQVNALLAASDAVTRAKVFYLGDYKPYDITEWADEIAACVHKKISTVPYFVFVGAALFGDVLTRLSIPFPMTSFRLKNMTTDNIYDLSLIESIAPAPPVSRLEGTKRTIDWMNNQTGAAQ